jgi:hypothetical protein
MELCRSVKLLRRRARLHSSQLVMQNMDRMSIQRPAWPGLEYPMSGTRTQPRTLTFSTIVYKLLVQVLAIQPEGSIHAIGVDPGCTAGVGGEKRP